MRFATLAPLFFLVGCFGQDGGAPRGWARRAAPAISEALVASASRTDAPTQRRRFGEAATYVDGHLVGVLRRAELSPALRPRKKRLLDGRQVERFALADYVVSLGVDPKRVTALHFHGGRGRVAMVDGPLFRRFPAALSFSFTRGHRGKPVLELPDDDAFRINTSIDLIQALAIYVNRPAPTYDREARALMLEGRRLDGVAYVPAEELRGTRVYLDGTMIGALKRKTLPDALLTGDAPAGSVPRFSLQKFVAWLGADLARVRAVELLAGDDRIARLGGLRFRSGGPEPTFTIPRKSQGRLLLELPPGVAELADAHEGSARISAIQLYSRMPPPDAKLDPLPDEEPPGETRPAAARADDEE